MRIASMSLAVLAALASPAPAQETDLEALGKKLKAAVKSGEMTEEQAKAKWQAAMTKLKTQKKPKAGASSKRRRKGKQSMLEVAAELQSMVKTGKLTQEDANAKFRAILAKDKRASGKREAVDLEALGRKLKAAVAKGEMTGEEAKAKYMRVARMQGGGKRMAGKKGMRAGTFYAIFIGRLGSKDVELGEFELVVDHVTSIYGDRSRKAGLLGKTLKVKACRARGSTSSC